MTDNKVGSRLTQDFQEICQRTNEFHFPHVDDQLDKISATAHQYLKSQLKETTSRNTNSELLQAGDFYITRHSNLAQVHVVFHMVSDDSLRGSDINSRHPVVLGLRNILKTACSNDITSLTIPLLLQYDMTEVKILLHVEQILTGVLGDDNILVRKKSRTGFQMCQRFYD